MKMAFCTKCGTQLPEDSKFCPGCGAKIDAAPAEQVKEPAPEVKTEPAEQVKEAAPEVTPEPEKQAEEPAPEVKPEPQPAPVAAPRAAAPDKPKKKSNLKLFIILGAAGAALIAFIIVFLVAILPEITATHINMADYVEAKFTSDYYVDGHINGTLKLDLEKAYKENVTPDKGVSYYDFRKFFSDFSSEFKNKKAEDVVTENVTFVSMFRDIGELERTLGVRFDKDVVTQVKLSDELKKDNITVEKPVETDFFKYIDKCYYNTGIKQKGVSVDLEEKTFKSDGYTFKTYGFKGEYGSKSCYFYIAKGSKSITSFEVSADKSTGKNGSSVKFSLIYSADENDKNLLKGTPFIIKKTSKVYTIKSEKGLDSAQAVDYMQRIRSRLRDLYSTSSYKMNINGVYLLTAKNKNSDTVNMVVSLITKKGTSRYSSAYYIADTMKNCRIDPREKKSADKFKYESTDYKFESKSMSKLWNSLKNKYGSKYKIKKVG
ncbi:MAG: zinc-ribbon domain-containing protein [Clostridia bacterium]|nr:zinc-ribbon domain-containing protein [Clostridia bacterium]MBQ7503717.1 zinc-ribbon domain-containing protein [Ruminococcus sp.]